MVRKRKMPLDSLTQLAPKRKQILRKLDTELEKMKKSTPPARPSFREVPVSMRVLNVGMTL